MNRLYRLAAVLLILWLATALRFYRLDAQSFWNDEGNSARLSERPLPLIIEGTASDIHPPLYYLLLHGWRGLVGETEFGLRALSAFAGVGVVAVTVALARQGPGRKGTAVPAAVGLAAALNPALVYYSQEARMYELLALWAALATLLLLRLPYGRYPFRIGMAYVLAAAAGLYTHYFYPAVLLAHNILVGLYLFSGRRDRKVAGFGGMEGGGRSRRPYPTHAGRWFLMMAATLILYLPWLPIFWRQAAGRPGDSVPPLEFLQEALLFIGFGPAGNTWPQGLALGLLLLLLLLLAAWRQATRGRWQAVGGRRGVGPVQAPPWQVGGLWWAAFAGLVIPLGMMAILGTTRPAYHKFLLVAVPFYALIVGVGVVALWRLAGGRWQVAGSVVALLFGVAFLGANGRALHALYFDPALARADYRSMAAHIAAANDPNAGIILNAPNQWEVFTYYHRDGAPVYPLPAGRPEPERIAADLGEIAARHDRLYALFWGEGERDPERLVERWLDAHAFKATEEWVGDVRFVIYAVPAAPAAAMETTSNARFGEQITLLGYTLSGEQFRPGDILGVTLFWQTDAALETRYKVFLHLLDEGGSLVTQRDSEPGGGLALTTTWTPGATIIDNHGVLIPAGTPPGRYTLLLGLYDAADPNARLPLDEPAGDTLPLGTVLVN